MDLNIHVSASCVCLYSQPSVFVYLLCTYMYVHLCMSVTGSVHSCIRIIVQHTIILHVALCVRMCILARSYMCVYVRACVREPATRDILEQFHDSLQLFTCWVDLNVRVFVFVFFSDNGRPAIHGHDRSPYSHPSAAQVLIQVCTNINLEQYSLYVQLFVCQVDWYTLCI